MTYILYTTIARAGGLDLLLGLESFSRPERQQLHRRPRGHRLAGARRRGGRVLIALGGALSQWGRRWSAPAGAISQPWPRLVGE